MIVCYGKQHELSLNFLYIMVSLQIKNILKQHTLYGYMKTSLPKLIIEIFGLLINMAHLPN